MRYRSVVVGATAIAVVAIAVLITSLIRIVSANASDSTRPVSRSPAAPGTPTLASLAAAPTGPVVTVPELGTSASPSPEGGSMTSSSPPPATVPTSMPTTVPTSMPTTVPTTVPTTESTPPASRSTPATGTRAASSTTPPATTSHSAAPATAPSHVDPITPAPRPSAAAIVTSVTQAVKAAARTGISESVVVLDRATGKQVVAIDADRPVPAVSIAKLLFAADELDQAGGGAHLDDDAADDLFEMIARSDDQVADDYYGYHGEGEIVERVAERYHLTGTSPAPNPRYWGGITVTASDIASLLQQVLSDPADGPYLAAPMQAATVYGADGYDQEFGMNAVSGAGSKQGWGCCLGGVVAIHSAGFDSRDIVVILSTAAPDASGLDVPQVSAFADDPGFEASVAAVTATARAAVDPSS